jgi:beta-phosphoglucomutase-like phosphatase (HAD superfamily)
MITTALFDIDGVVTKKRTELHSKRFAREYTVPDEEVKRFFELEFSACLTGDADLKAVRRRAHRGMRTNRAGQPDCCLDQG